MGYRDSENNNFSRHGTRSDFDDTRYGERFQREGYDRGEPRGGWRPDWEDRSDRTGPYGVARGFGGYGGYGENRGDDYGYRPSFDQERFNSQDRYQNSDPYRVRRQGAFPGSDPSEAELFDRQSRAYGRDEPRRDTFDNGRVGGQYYGRQQHHDPDYKQWREDQMRRLDEDYDSWRQERYQKFSDDFNTWRSSKSQADSATGKNQSTAANSGNNSATGKNKDTN